MTVHYRNQKFFLQIEGEQIEIGNPFDIKRFLYILLGDIFLRQPGMDFDKLIKDGDSFPLPSGIGYRKNSRCIGEPCGTECLYEGCAIERTCTLYVIEEEKELEKTFVAVLHEFEQIGYNQAIDDVLKLFDSFIATRNNVEKLKKW